MKNKSFAVFILSHGRAENQITLKRLLAAGYTGDWFIVIDDEDAQASRYFEIYGDRVIQFCKRDVAQRVDAGDNFDDRRSCVYVRCALHEIAESLGYEFYIQFDDDYTHFGYRSLPGLKYGHHQVRKTMDDLLDAMIDFLRESGALSVAMSQGGDHLGGGNFDYVWRLKRKAMNSFLCSTKRQFDFVGRLNDDVNTYVSHSHRGGLFFTLMGPMLTQAPTQQQAGGLTEAYLDSGTYVKSFYSVMYCPSAVKVSVLQDPQRPDNARIHHKINWNNCAPKILRESFRKKLC